MFKLWFCWSFVFRVVPSVSLSIHSVSLHVCLYVCLSLSILSVSLCLSLSVSLSLSLCLSPFFLCLALFLFHMNTTYSKSEAEYLLGLCFFSFRLFLCQRRWDITSFENWARPFFFLLYTGQSKRNSKIQCKLFYGYLYVLKHVFEISWFSFSTFFLVNL